MVARAVIFVPQIYQVAQYAATCLEHCARHGYEVVGLVHGDWKAAAEMLYGGSVAVLVVARPDHLDPGRLPRVEVVPDSEPVSPVAGTPARRRPRSI